MFAPLKERNYRLWAAADLVSTAGTWMQVLGLNWLILSAYRLGRRHGRGRHAAVPAGARDGGRSAARLVRRVRLLSTVFAVGAVTGGLLLAGGGRSTLRVLLASGFLISVLQLCSGLAPNVLGFAAVMLPIAAGAVVFDTVVSTRIQLDTREDMRGRVLATVGIVSSLSGIVGAPAVGWLSDTLGPRGALVLAGAITTAAAVAGAIAVARAQGRTLRLPVPALRRPAEQPA